MPKGLKHFQSKVEFRNYDYVPHPLVVFRPWEDCSFEKTRVVLLCIEPTRNQSHCSPYCLSTPLTAKTPSRVTKDILEHLRFDVPGVQIRSHDLSCWAKKGVLMIHVYPVARTTKELFGKWFEGDFLIYEALRELSIRKEKCVFILFGKQVKKFLPCLDNPNHLVMCINRPGSNQYLKSYRKFSGHNFFSRSAEYLEVDPKELWRVT